MYYIFKRGALSLQKPKLPLVCMNSKYKYSNFCLSLFERTKNSQELLKV